MARTPEQQKQYEKVRQKIAKALREKYMGDSLFGMAPWKDTPFQEYWLAFADVALSIPELEIKDIDQSLPNEDERHTWYKDDFGEAGRIGYRLALQDIFATNFVKVIPKE